MADIAYIRKVAAREERRRAFSALTSHELPALDRVLLHKAGSADRELLLVAAALRPEHPVATYDALGLDWLGKGGE